MQYQERIGVVVKWIARILGGLLLVFVVLMVGGELVEHLFGEPMFFIHSVSDVIGLLFFPIYCTGVAIAFKKERLGGLIIICAVTSVLIADGQLAIDIITGVFAFSGVLFLLSWVLDRKLHSQ